MKQLRKRRITILLSIVLVFVLACSTRLASRMSFAAYTLPDPAVVGTATLQDGGDTVFIRMANFNVGTEERPYYSVGAGFTVGNFGTAEDPTQNVDMSVLTPLYSETALSGVLDKDIYICGGGSYAVDLYVDGLTLTEGHTLTAVKDFDMKMGDLTVSKLIAPNVTAYIGDKAALTVNGDAAVNSLWLYKPSNDRNFYNPEGRGGTLRVRGNLTGGGTTGWIDISGASSLTVDGDLSGFKGYHGGDSCIWIANGSSLNVGGSVSNVGAWAISGGSKVNVVGSLSSSNLVAYKGSLVHAGGDLNVSGFLIAVESAISAGGSVKGDTVNLINLTAPATVDGGVSAGDLWVSGASLTVTGPINTTRWLDIYNGGAVTAGDVDVSMLFMESFGNAVPGPNVLNAASFHSKADSCVMNDSTLNVAGDCKIDSGLFNVNKGARMTVGGNATIRCFIDVMNNSTLSVAGDITHKGGYSLVLQAMSASTITCGGNVTAYGVVSARDGSHITVAGTLTAAGDLGVLSFINGSTVEAGAVIATGLNVFDTSSITSHGDAVVDNMAYVRNDGVINIGGDLDCKEYSIGQKAEDGSGDKGGTIDVGGDMTVNMPSGNIDTGAITVGGDFINTAEQSDMGGNGIAVYGGKITVGGNVEFGKLLLNTAGHPERLDVAGQINAMRITDIKGPVDENGYKTVTLYTAAPFESKSSDNFGMIYYVQPYRQKYVLLVDPAHATPIYYYADVSDLNKTRFDAVPLTAATHAIDYELGEGVSWAPFATIARMTIDGVQIALPIADDVVNPGKRLAGWNTSADGKGTTYAAGEVLSCDGDLTLYPQWENAPLKGKLTVSGSAVYHKTLTAALTADNNTGTLSYQWYRGETAIEGANSAEYVLAAADVGKTISCAVRSSAQTGSVHSLPTLAVKPIPVTVTGLTAANKTYDGTTDAEITGEAALRGVLEGDEEAVSLVPGTAAFGDANVGEAKPVTFSGYSLTGEAAGGYALSQPAITRANITPMSITPNITLGFTQAVYDRGEQKPTVTVTADETTIPADAYTVRYSGNVNAGAAGVVVESRLGGNYAFAESKAAFTIVRRSITPTLELEYETTEYAGYSLRPNVTVVDDETQVREREYTVEYSDNTNAGTAKVTVRVVPGRNYAFDDIATTFTIVPKSITPTVTLEYETTEYDGKAKEPTVTVWLEVDKETLAEGTDYTIEYSGNTNAGTAKVTVKAKENGNYAFDDIERTFTIRGVKGTVSGSTVSYTVVDAPEGSLLIAARYNGGRLTCVRLLEVGGNKTDTLTMDGSGTEYKLMLVNGSYAPLCKAATVNEK